MKITPRAFIGAAFVAMAAAGTYLLTAGVGAGDLRYYKAAEYAALASPPSPCQVHGTVAPGSVVRLPVGVRFVLMEGAARIPVEYTDLVPDAFAENRELVVEGSGTATAFKAERLLVKCPSKYNPAEEQKKQTAKAG